MLVRGMKPDAFTYNIIIYAYCKQGKVKYAIQVFDRNSAVEGWHPDIIAYTTLLWGISNWIGVEEAIFYLQRMVNEGIFPNITTWNVLVRCFFSNLGHMGPIHILDDILANG
jgi:pentatricopeptide repeat protein